MKLYILALSLACLITACSGSKPVKSDPEPDLSVEAASRPEPRDDSLAKKAELFNRYILKRLSAEEDVALRKTCNNTPEENVFCFSVLNYDYFQGNYQKKEIRARKRRRRRRVYPKFRGKLVRNWKQLRYASIGRTIGSVASISRKQLNYLVARAQKEEKCPNNVAVSIAAALEDRLPQGSDPSVIGELYVKGGDCLTGNSGDRRTLITRGGLFYFYAENYEKALETFDRAVAIDNAFLSRPLFWKYRTELQLKKEDAAQETLKELTERYPFAFHTLVAQMKNKKDPGDDVLDGTFDSLKRSQQAPTVNLLVEQVEILHHFGYDQSANQILNWAITEAEEAEPELKVYLAELKRGDRDHYRKISLLSNVLYDNPELISRKTMELYFPKPFFPIFEKHAEDVDPYLLMAIARQESAFNPRAISAAKAQGLLQLLPKTAKRLSKNSHKKLFDPQTNIRVGSKYFNRLVNKVNGQVHLALAAYNAGPKRISTWTKRYTTSDPVLFIDLIPYRETRDYVALILRNYYWYRRINAENEDQYPETVIIEREQAGKPSTDPRKK